MPLPRLRAFELARSWIAACPPSGPALALSWHPYVLSTRVAPWTHLLASGPAGGRPRGAGALAVAPAPGPVRPPGARRARQPPDPQRLGAGGRRRGLRRPRGAGPAAPWPRAARAGAGRPARPRRRARRAQPVLPRPGAVGRRERPGRRLGWPPRSPPGWPGSVTSHRPGSRGRTSTTRPTGRRRTPPSCWPRPAWPRPATPSRRACRATWSWATSAPASCSTPPSRPGPTCPTTRTPTRFRSCSRWTASRCWSTAASRPTRAGEERAWWRSTAAHSTVQVDGLDSSEVVGAHRSGQLATTTIEADERAPGHGGPRRRRPSAPGPRPPGRAARAAGLVGRRPHARRRPLPLPPAPGARARTWCSTAARRASAPALRGCA